MLIRCNLCNNLYDPNVKHYCFLRDIRLTNERFQMKDQTPHQARVESFMVKAGQVVPSWPCVPSDDVLMLRAKLIMEEALETIQAMGIDLEVRYTGVGAGGEIPVNKTSLRFKHNQTRLLDLIGVADGCADISVVTIGTLSAFGMQDNPILKAVDESNLAKFRGDAHRCPETGKWVKPSDWQPPNLLKVLIDQGLNVEDYE